VHHRLSGLPTYRFSGLRKGDEHLAYALLEYDTFTFTLHFTATLQQLNEALILCFSRNGEVHGSRNDFNMNSVVIDSSTGSALLDVKSQSLISTPTVQQPQHATDANS